MRSMGVNYSLLLDSAWSVHTSTSMLWMGELFQHVGEHHLVRIFVLTMWRWFPCLPIRPHCVRFIEHFSKQTIWPSRSCGLAGKITGLDTGGIFVWFFFWGGGRCLGGGVNARKRLFNNWKMLQWKNLHRFHYRFVERHARLPVRDVNCVSTAVASLNSF